MKQKIVGLLAFPGQFVREVHNGISVTLSYPPYASYAVLFNKQICNLLGFFTFDSAAVKDCPSGSYKISATGSASVVSVAVFPPAALYHIFHAFFSEKAASLVRARNI